MSCAAASRLATAHEQTRRGGAGGICRNLRRRTLELPNSLHDERRPSSSPLEITSMAAQRMAVSSMIGAVIAERPVNDAPGGGRAAGEET